MKKFILACLLLLVLGCGDGLNTVHTGNSAPNAGFSAFATLSSTDTIEAAASVVYTQMARFRHGLARALRAQKITVEQAVRWRDQSVDIGDYLAAAVNSRNALKIASAGKKLAALSKELEGYL